MANHFSNNGTIPSFEKCFDFNNYVGRMEAQGFIRLNWQKYEIILKNTSTFICINIIIGYQLIFFLIAH